MTKISGNLKNRLLQSMQPSDLEILDSHLRREDLQLRRFFEHTAEPIAEVCFPETAIISVVARSGAGRSIEAALVGFEGMSGVPILLGDDRSPNETYVQVAGVGHIVSADALRSAIASSSTLHLHLLRYGQTLMALIAQTALANGRSRIDERLARWLLMASDRLQRTELSLTHDLVSLMLGVRRPGVTDAIHRLEGELLIKARRASITIRDRAGLEAFAGDCYGVAERNYERLFGPIRFGAANEDADQRRSA